MNSTRTAIYGYRFTPLEGFFVPDIHQERWINAFDRVARVERESSLLKSRFFPRRFSYAKRSAWATADGLNVLPEDQQHETSSARLRARVRAESVLIGKFDVQKEVRLRAFYPNNGISTRYQTGGKNNGVIRTVRAFEKVRDHAPALMPEVYEHGTILDGRGAFLVEETVQGETATRAQLESLIDPLTKQLGAVHRGVGISDKRASVVLGRHSLGLWNKFVELHDLDPLIDEKVQELYSRDSLLEVSLTHGDLVNSNILVDDNRFVLVDWEWASIKPIAFDMAKMIINVSDIEDVLQRMHSGLGGSLGTKSTHYMFREQVALALVQTLTFYQRQLVKARKAKRTGALTRQTNKRVKALTELLNPSSLKAGDNTGDSLFE